MNILGQPFAPWVTKQINVRQQSLGYVNYDNNDLLYQNNKTPWIRLASSVDIEQAEDGVLDKFNKIGISQNQVKGPVAARNFILQGGAMGIDSQGEFIKYTGINTSNQFYNGAYGWGETTERGFVPLPGVIDASLIYYSNGALSKGVINMKCYSRNQLALMDVLYMRPGYNLLLEFGWTSWLDNETREVTTFDTFQSPALEFMLGANAQGTDSNPSNFEIPRLIQAEREKTDGNYEGVFGKITNFNWSFESDGSYSCQTTITGMGGVIESLKINGATFSKKEKQQFKAAEAAIKENADDLDSDAVEKQQSALNATRLKTELDDTIDFYYQSFKDQLTIKAADTIDYGYINTSFSSFRDPKDGFKTKKLVLKDAICGLDGVDTDDEENLTPVCYLSFAGFIAVLQDNFLIYNSDGSPYFSFNMDFFNIEKDDNYIINLPGQFSANPLVCFTPYNNVTEGVSAGENVNIPSTNLSTVFDKVKDRFIVEAGTSQFLGRLAHVYLNFQFIKKCLAEAPRDSSDNSLALLPFLKTILAGVSKARGGINNILIHEDINTNTIKLIEEVPQNWAKQIPPKSEADTYCQINTYGVKNKVEGSIVRSLDMNATISSDFSSMISIGAQNNGNQLNENATAFSKYNRGLIDRTFKEKVTTKTAEKTKTPLTEEDTKEKETLSTLWNDKMNEETDDSKGLFNSIMTEVKWLNEDITALESINVSFVKMLLGLLATQNVIQAPFFLPFNLSLDIDGISGIKLYQKFTIDDSVLPPAYDKDSVDLQIKAANHTVSAGDWITKIETQSVPRSKDIKIAKIKPLTAKSSTSNSRPDGTALPPPPGTQPPEDELLRLRLTRIMDDGTQTLGVMEVLAEDETTVLYTLPTSELPWKGNENRVSCIPTDNYRVKSHVSGKHGRCFWLIGNEQGGYAFNKLFGNGYIRTAVLIHMFPKAPGWALGCIGPGLKFNTSGDQKGRQQGTGKKYLNPAKAESYKALDKLLATLYSVGSYKMQIVNQGGVSSTSLPTTFNESVKSIARSYKVL